MIQMNNNEKEEELYSCVIPENFVDTGRCFNGAFKTRNFIEGAIVAGPMFYLIMQCGLPIERKLAFAIIGAGSIFALFLVGINEDSVTEFIQSYFGFKKRKRIARYNPRVKTEASPGYLTRAASELPRDKVLRLMDAYMTRKKEEEDIVSRDIYDPIYKEYFEDDLGVLTTPEGLKTRSEKKHDQKIKKAKLKALKKQAKLELKSDKKQAKLETKRARKELAEAKQQAKKDLKVYKKRGDE